MPDYDLVVLGGGPGGYIAAIRAAQLGLKTAVVERDEVGGICLNWGCIPSKALLRNAEVVSLVRDASRWGIAVENPTFDMAAAIDRSRQVVDRMVKGVRYLFRKHGIALHQGVGRLSAADRVTVDGAGETLGARHIILATGARARDLPNLRKDGELVLTAREALELRERPASIAIIGGGAIGMEFAYFWRAYGVDVTVIEMMPRLLPLEDEEVSQHLERAVKRLGIKVKTGARVQTMDRTEGGARLTLESGDTVDCEKVLLGIGNVANTEDLGLEALGVEMDRGFIKSDDYYRTNVPNVYAIGDVNGRLLLAHVASAQGGVAVEHMAGKSPRPLDYRALPRATYCQPQVASMGLTQREAEEQGYQVKASKFPFSANGKMLALGYQEGFVKLVADARDGEILGAHIIGHDVTELVAELSVARMLEGTPEELGGTVHAHPTLSEAVMEAGLGVFGQSLNI